VIIPDQSRSDDYVMLYDTHTVQTVLSVCLL